MPSDPYLITMRSQLIEHITTNLGQLERAWTTQADGTPLPFEVRPVADRPMRGATTFVTVGLSDSPLAFPSGATTREELVFCTYSRYRASEIPPLLTGIGLEMLERRRAYARGEVLGPGGALLPETKMEALYCGLPVYFPEAFAGMYSTDPPTLFLWLIPVHGREAEYIRTHGWSKFEHLLLEQDPDLLDLRRPEIRLPC